jgi:hypothetical protein
MEAIEVFWRGFSACFGVLFGIGAAGVATFFLGAAAFFACIPMGRLADKVTAWLSRPPG